MPQLKFASCISYLFDIILLALPQSRSAVIVLTLRLTPQSWTRIHTGPKRINQQVLALMQVHPKESIGRVNHDSTVVRCLKMWDTGFISALCHCFFGND